ncbi:DUF393 domain-containing protein [Aquibacillus halophilus]|uniref:DUF393 domain-containing protein n=1 Tax=Aquibacillus halophilus TaxID=930132 RepID=A0A6A8DLW1_9BACI|nr:DUF393 domain-containing protein [Aquibacillus halophilus]MRH44791.1 DUF393 domain-containing protein [Aquibacillus halophilus]
MNQATVLYDETCYLCQQSKKIIQLIDWLRVFEWQSLQTYSGNHILTDEQLSEMEGEIHLITKKDSVLVGYFAVRYILLRCPITVIIGLLMYIPKSPKVGVPAYRWVAKNRYQLFKKKCKGVCKIPK